MVIEIKFLSTSITMPDRVIQVLLILRGLPHSLCVYHELIEPELLELSLLDHELRLIVF